MQVAFEGVPDNEDGPKQNAGNSLDGAANSKESVCSVCSEHGNASTTDSYQLELSQFEPYYCGPAPPPIPEMDLQKCTLHLRPTLAKAALLRLIVQFTDDFLRRQHRAVYNLLHSHACELRNANMPLLELAIRGRSAWGTGNNNGFVSLQVTQSVFRDAAGWAENVVRLLLQLVGQWTSREAQLKRPLLTMAVQKLDWRSAELLLKFGFEERSAVELIATSLAQIPGNNGSRFHWAHRMTGSLMTLLPGTGLLGQIAECDMYNFLVWTLKYFFFSF